jgi:hypothetical protein
MIKMRNFEFDVENDVSFWGKIETWELNGTEHSFVFVAK